MLNSKAPLSKMQEHRRPPSGQGSNRFGPAGAAGAARGLSGGSEDGPARVNESLHETPIAAAPEVAPAPDAGGQAPLPCRFDDVDPGVAAAAVAGADRKSATTVEASLEAIEDRQFGRREAEVHPAAGDPASGGPQAGVFGLTNLKRTVAANFGRAASGVSADDGLNDFGNLKGAVAEEVVAPHRPEMRDGQDEKLA